MRLAGPSGCDPELDGLRNGAAITMTDLTILMPCLNEAETLGTCISKARDWATSRADLHVEVVVADNGSADGSVEIAESLGARVVHVQERGYGSALFAGCAAAHGRWIIFADADDSYDFSDLSAFVSALDDGADLVMGNRFAGGIEPGAMPWKNRYIGNPTLSLIGRLLFKIPTRDFHCGLRGLTKDAFARMDLRTTGMEFASEMVIKASQAGMAITEVPTTLSKDGRSRPPHLRPWRDGWRHLRFMMLFSPRWLFLVPGLFMLVSSSLVYIRLLLGPWRLGDVTLDVHTLFFAQTGLTLGALTVLTGLATRALGARDGSFTERRYLSLIRTSPGPELGALGGLASLLLGVLWGGRALARWGSEGFGALEAGELLRTISLSTSLLTFGGLVFVFSLLMGFLALPTRDARGLDAARADRP
jgi:glycosyltransferase involved in cell wall biosynthesis